MKTVKQLAKYYKVSEETIRRWFRSGKLKGIKEGRGYLLPSDPKIKELVNEIEKRTSLSYEGEDEIGNLVPQGLNTIQELIERLKEQEKNHKLSIELLRKIIQKDKRKGYVVELDSQTMTNTMIEGDIYILGNNFIISGNYLAGRIIG